VLLRPSIRTRQFHRKPTLCQQTSISKVNINPRSITTTSAAAPLPSCTGKLYTVAAGDTCKSIAAANSLALDRFISENSIDYKCNSLVAGRTVCIGDSCSLHTIVANETCTGLVEGKDYTIIELQSWNPTIHKNCDNLDTMIGRSICNS